MRNRILDGTIKTFYVSTKNQLADVFTKALGVEDYLTLIKELGIINIFAHTIEYPQPTALSQEARALLLRESVKTIDDSAEHYSRVGELRCMSQAAVSAAPDEERCTSQATRIALEPTWASTDHLEVIEEVPYHEFFIHNFEELVIRS